MKEIMALWVVMLIAAYSFAGDVTITSSGTSGGSTRTVQTLATVTTTSGTAIECEGNIDFDNGSGLVGGIQANGSISSLRNTATITGDIAINGSIDMKSSSVITGDISADGSVTTDGGSMQIVGNVEVGGSCPSSIVTGTRNQNVSGIDNTIDVHNLSFDDDLPAEIMAVEGSKSGTVSNNDPSGHYDADTFGSHVTLPGSAYYLEGDLIMNNNKMLYVTQDVKIYVSGTFRLKNNAKVINYSGSNVYAVDLYVGGDVILAQGNTTNQHANATMDDFRIFTAGNVEIKSGSTYKGHIHSNGNIEFKHGGTGYATLKTSGNIDIHNSTVVEGPSGGAGATVIPQWHVEIIN